MDLAIISGQKFSVTLIIKLEISCWITILFLTLSLPWGQVYVPLQLLEVHQRGSNENSDETWVFNKVEEESVI